MKYKKEKFILPGALIIITLSYIFLSLQQDISKTVYMVIAAAAVNTGMLMLLSYVFGKKNIYISAVTIFFFAFFFRVIFLFQSPQLSDDIYRYLWDGLQSLNGINPYSAAPSSVIPLEQAGKVLLQKINHPQYVSIYPPSSQFIFASGAAITHGITGLKSLLVIMDMAICLMVLKLLKIMHLPAWRAILYAWHPLPIIEIAWSGHIDGAGVLFFFMMLYFLFLKISNRHYAGIRGNFFLKARKNSILFFAGILFAAAVYVKFIVLIYFPVIIAMAVSPLSLISGFLVGSIGICFPYMPELQNIIGTIGVYLGNWEFSNFAFRGLKVLTGSGAWARIILLFLFVVCNFYYSLFFYWKQKNSSNDSDHALFKAIYPISFTYLLLSPTLHPWYALYLAGLFPFISGPAGLLFSGAVFLSYHVLIEYKLSGIWIENDVIAAAIWFSPIIAYVVSIVISRLFSRNSQINSPV